ncbi:MAG: cation diffusion facilitator family transporter [Candidatus Zapsychrus exili]|nr:cation diffusion facilitator family transporter [Candidatus Zapsychrus exili]
MKKITRWITTTFIKNHKNIDDINVRAQYGFLEGWVSIVLNLLLFAIKIVLGLAVKSVSLIADAIHTLADSATSAAIIFGFNLAKKPSDKEHPFGHQKMEPIIALVIAVLLFVAGIELVERSIHSIMNPQSSVVSWWIIIVISITALIKELLSHFSLELGNIIDSEALKADALHHRSDVFTTVLVVIALVCSKFGLNKIDGIMGIGVSIIIVYSAYIIAKEAINPLLGEAPSKEELKEIENIARANDKVLGIHDIIYHKYGQTNIVSLHIEVSDKGNVNELHEISENIEENIAKKIKGIVVVHIDPINKDHPRYEEISNAIKETILEDDRVDSFHELRIVGRNIKKCNAVFDISLEESMCETKSKVIADSVRKRLKNKFPDMKFIIKTEPKYVYNI